MVCGVGMRGRKVKWKPFFRLGYLFNSEGIGSSWRTVKKRNYIIRKNLVGFKGDVALF